MKIEGLRVVRGPSWKWGDQDGGKGSVGTVVGFKKESGIAGLVSRLALPELDSRLSELFSERLQSFNEKKKKSGLVKVVWDCGTQADYRAGFEGCYDLLVVDDAAGGRKNPDIPCSLCNCPEIVGMRWQCSECHNNFCCSCFYKIVHLHEHSAFKRHDNSTNSEQVIVSIEPNTNLLLRGIFEGAKVKRSKDWIHSDDDGEQDGDVTSTDREGKVGVKWRSSGTTYTYRRVLEGKVELQAVKAATGGQYKPEWLPTLKVVTEGGSVKMVKPFSVGDRVKVVVSVDEFKQKQSGHGGWTESMGKAIGEVGTVFRVDNDGDVHVKFDKLDNKKWCINPAALKKLTQFSIGQVVRVRDDIETIKDMKNQLGNKVVSDMVGNTRRVTKIDIVKVDNEVGCENVHLELKKGTILERQPPLKPEWLEALPGVPPLEEKLFKIKLKLGDMFVDAAKGGTLYIMQDLMTNHNVSLDVDHKSTPGLTALHLASRKGHYDIIQWLLHEGADIEKEDDKGRTALYHSVKGGEVEALRLLIKNGAHLNTKTKTRGMTALQKAIAKRQTECAELLIDNGCDVNLQDKDGETPLHNALGISSVMMVDDVSTAVDALINSGRVDFDIRNNKGISVFHVAVSVGNVRVVQCFLTSNNAAKIVLHMIPKKLLNALHIACIKGYFKIAKLFLGYVEELDKLSMEEGVLANFINAKDKDGQTPLMMASIGNHYSLMELLANIKADVNVTDKNGDSALSLIVSKIGKNKKKPSIPKLGQSPAIHKIYQELCSHSHAFSEIMVKHPNLAAICYLISKGGDPERALSISSDANVNQIINFYTSNHPKRCGANQGSNCLICGRSSFPVLYPCCIRKSSIFCSNCCQKIKVCPCCKKLVQQKSSSTQHSNELIPDNQHSLRAMASHEKVMRENIALPTGEADILLRETAPSESAPQPSTSRLTAHPDREIKVKKRRRKNTYVLLDNKGNAYTKKRPNIWQCTKKCDIQKNECPALIKEKREPDGTVKFEIFQPEHKHSESATGNLVVKEVDESDGDVETFSESPSQSSTSSDEQPDWEILEEELD